MQEEKIARCEFRRQTKSRICQPSQMNYTPPRWPRHRQRSERFGHHIAVSHLEECGDGLADEAQNATPQNNRLASSQAEADVPHREQVGDPVVLSPPRQLHIPAIVGIARMNFAIASRLCLNFWSRLSYLHSSPIAEWEREAATHFVIQTSARMRTTNFRLIPTLFFFNKEEQKK